MSRKTVSEIMLSLLVISTLTLAFKVQLVRADDGTITINADGSITPSTAPVFTSDNITYILTGNVTTAPGADGIVVERDNIVLEGAGYTVTGSGNANGTILTDMSNVAVNNVVINSFMVGIWLDSSSNNNVLSGNNVTASDYGILINSSSNNIISGNDITNNFIGILLNSSSNNNISGNNLTNNDEGISFEFSSDNNNLSGNNIATNVAGGIGIEIDASPDNSLIGNNITNGVVGLDLDYYSSSTFISGNSFVNCGLLVSVSYEKVLTDNLVNGKPLVYLQNVSNYEVGDAGQVILIDCSNVTVENLNLSNATIGLELEDSNNVVISGNNITANELIGIMLSSSSNNRISGNNITNNNYGFYVAASSNNNVNGNNITNNIWGFYIIFQSNNNMIYHNNLVNNGHQVYTDGSPNVWDNGYPSGGNYWSDYNCTDVNSGQYQNLTGSDGIGDTPYLIDANNTDNYPLTSPWLNTHVVGDLNRDGKVNLEDLVLLANAYGSKPGDSNWNPNADMAPPYGIISLTDLVTLATHYGQHNP